MTSNTAAPLSRAGTFVSGPAEQVLQARWVAVDHQQLLSPGVIHTRAGRIVRVREGTDASAVNLGEVAILPGLINAHTHLEFSQLTQPLASGAPFPDWIQAVIGWRRTHSGDTREAIAAGWDESIQAGSIAIGEIATADDTWDELARRAARGVVFREIYGLQAESVSMGLERARRFLPIDAPSSPLLHRGLSPHAPYTLHPTLLAGLIELAVEAQCPVAMHLAETRAELELLSRQSGGLVDLLQSLRLWQPELFADYRRPLDYLRLLGRCRRALVVHGNYLSEDELDYLTGQPQMSVVYCPRTHAAFGHAPHPWRALQDRGVRVVIGTDSRASNPDLSLVNELRWLQTRFPDVAPQTLLRMATSDAAEATGLSGEFGALTAGLQAAFTLLTPGRPLTPDDWSGLWLAPQ